MAIKKNRILDVEERNQKIETMGMQELRKYLCYKNNQDPNKCISCPGKMNCKAGQRAIVLLNEIALQETMEAKKSTKGMSMNDRKKEVQMKFIQAFSQQDPIAFVMEKYGNNRNLARTKLRMWAKSNPDIAEQYGFWEKLNEADKRNGAIKRYEEAIKQPDPIAFMMDKYGWSKENAQHNLSQWKRRYGSVEKEETNVNKDEISIEDFLKEHGSTEEAVQEAAEPEKQDGEFGSLKGFSGELNAKYQELEREKDKLKDRLAWIEKAQDALAMTLNIFNPESAIGKAVNG